MRRILAVYLQGSHTAYDKEARRKEMRAVWWCICLLLYITACRPAKGQRNVAGYAGPENWGWERENTQSVSNLFGITAIEDGNVLAVGDDDTILKSVDGGSTWMSGVSGLNNPDCTVACERYLWRGVHFWNVTTGWLAGSYGWVLRTGDAGNTWEAKVTADSLVFDGVGYKVDLHAVQAVGPEECFVVGDAGKILHTRDGGDTWQAQSSRVDFSPLYSLSFVDPLHGWVAGGGSLQGRILVTTDGGAIWDFQYAINSTFSLAYRGIVVVNSTHGWAAGDEGGMLRTIDGGETWISVESCTSNTIYDITYNNIRGYGFVVAEHGVICWSWDAGLTWTYDVMDDGSTLRSVHGKGSSVSFPLAAGEQGTVRLYGLDLLTTGEGFIVGEEDTILHTKVSGGAFWSVDTILTTVDDDTSWRLGHSNIANPCENCPRYIWRGVSFQNSLVGVVVGSYGGIIRTEDGGETWTQRASMVSAVYGWSDNTVQLMRVQFLLGSDTAYAVGFSDTILRSDDAGLFWTRQDSRTSSLNL
ncbi:hypothetical protein CYMTET_18296, partial [Cymbomonas tetramitiformis]